MDLSTTTVGSPAAVAYQEAAASVVHTEVGAKRLDLSRRPTCCTTWQRPTNIGLLRKSTVWPNTRPSVYERFVRHLQYAAGIGWLQANTSGCSQATLSHVSLLGLSAQRHRATENFGSPSGNFGSPVRKAANRASSDAHEHLRTLTESLDSTGTSGFHPGPPGSRAPLGSSPAAFTNKSPSGFTAHRRRARRTSVPHPCVITATGHLRTLTGIFGFHPNLLEIQKPPSKVTA